MRKIEYPRPLVKGENFDPVDLAFGHMSQKKPSFAGVFKDIAGSFRDDKGNPARPGLVEAQGSG
jgi:hypothetical protein